jgi:CheY-like chemotaxis protein
VEVDAAYAAGKPGLTPGRFVRIRVTDTGSGMDAATLRRAFEPFFTTKPKGQGTGLGLATVYGIVTQAGGDISIYSELGIGTRVHVLLPASDRAPHLAAPDMTGLQPPASAVRILVVEDADDLREITELILKKAGYQVITANNGAQALKLLGHLHGEVDLLLTDVVMPRMQGPELVEKIKAVHPGIRVLYMSGYAQTILGDGGTLADGVLLIEKPFTETVLLGKVEQALHAGILVAS